MNTLSFDSTAAQHYDIENFLPSKLAGRPADQEVTVDFSQAPKESRLKRHLPKLLAQLATYNVVKIDLSNAELSDQEVRQVAEAIKKQPSIKMVVLANNKIHDAGAQELAKAMEANKNLDVVLRNNSIGPTGAVAYVKAAIAAGKTEIDLSSNKLGDIGAKNVAAELAKDSNQVDTLILKGNKIGNLGDRYLASQVPEHIRIFYRVERGSILNSCPGMSNTLTRFFAAPIDYMLSSVLAQQEPEGTLHPRKKTE